MWESYGFGITRKPPKVFLFSLYLKIAEKTVRDKKSRRKYILPCSRVIEEKDLVPTSLHQNPVQEDMLY